MHGVGNCRCCKEDSTCLLKFSKGNKDIEKEYSSENSLVVDSDTDYKSVANHAYYLEYNPESN